MYKYLTTILLIITSLTCFSQTSDSVATGLNNANDVYYSFNKGIIKTTPVNNWDLAFEIAGFSASVLANQVKGIEVYQAPFTSSKWGTFDTTGKKAWKRLFNSQHKWTLGAFNRHTDGNFDLGWGVYEPGTHVIVGDSIYLLKFADGSYKKLTFISLNSGIYNFKHAMLDGSGEKTISIAKSDYKNKNFAYFSFGGEDLKDREPVTTEWDILFTKYTEFIPTPYNVGGIWTNKGVTTAEARGVPVSTTDFTAFRFSDSNSVIGYDWKTFNMQANKYEITNNLVYFVRTVAGAKWKIVFTGYKGGADGKYYFTKHQLAAGISKMSQLNIGLYPNPSSEKMILTIPEGIKFIGYSISDVSGKIVAEATDKEIVTSLLPNGIYHLSAHTEQGIQHIKFSKISH